MSSSSRGLWASQGQDLALAVLFTLWKHQSGSTGPGGGSQGAEKGKRAPKGKAKAKAEKAKGRNSTDAAPKGAEAADGCPAVYRKFLLALVGASLGSPGSPRIQANALYQQCRLRIQYSTVWSSVSSAGTLAVSCRQPTAAPLPCLYLWPHASDKMAGKSSAERNGNSSILSSQARPKAVGCWWPVLFCGPLLVICR